MNDKILYVDDDPNILAACKRSLGRKLKITTATGGAEGLEVIRKDGPFAVVLSDMRMPNMDGLEFICAVRQQAPDTVCMMLTGNSDQETAMNAVNKGQIFRFLTKPCPQDVLLTALEAGVRQYQLVTAERELLQNTLTGSIRALADVLALVNPKAFTRSSRIKPVVKVLVEELKLDHPWQYEIAAMLSQIGCIVLPPETIDKVFSKGTLTEKEEQMYASHPKHGGKLLDHIPRMEQSARMIERQLERYEAADKSAASEVGGDVALGSQIIHAATGFISYLSEGLGSQVATARMREMKGEYNPQLIDILSAVPVPGVDVARKGTVKELTVWKLAPGMYAEDDILTTTGTLLVPKGNEITYAHIERLKNFAIGVGIKEPILVLVPEEPVAYAA